MGPVVPNQQHPLGSSARVLLVTGVRSSGTSVQIMAASQLLVSDTGLTVSWASLRDKLSPSFYK